MQSLQRSLKSRYDAGLSLSKFSFFTRPFNSTKISGKTLPAGTDSARSNRFCLLARSMQVACAQTYAPRPDFFPVGSTTTAPPSFSGSRTTRSKALLSDVCLQTTHDRIGRCRVFFAGETASELAVIILPNSGGEPKFGSPPKVGLAIPRRSLEACRQLS